MAFVFRKAARQLQVTEGVPYSGRTAVWDKGDSCLGPREEKEEEEEEGGIGCPLHWQYWVWVGLLYDYVQGQAIAVGGTDCTVLYCVVLW